jgi:transposase
MRIDLQELSKDQLIEIILGLERRLAELEARNAVLEAEVARLRKDSSTSHKPPSSDIVKAAPATHRHGKKRRIGGQPGHPRHERPPFPPEQIDQTRTYTLKRCPDCGGRLKRSCEPWCIVQQVELVEKPVIVTEHRALTYWCPQCRKVHRARLPAEVRAAGLVGPSPTSAVWRELTVFSRFFGSIWGAVCRKSFVGHEGPAEAARKARVVKT